MLSLIWLFSKSWRWLHVLMVVLGLVLMLVMVKLALVHVGYADCGVIVFVIFGNTIQFKFPALDILSLSICKEDGK